MSYRVTRRCTSQPKDGQVQIDWTNPHTKDLVFATYAENGSIFRDMVGGRWAVEVGGPNAFNTTTITPWGRGKFQRGSSYGNRFNLAPSSTGPENQRGQISILALVVPRVTDSLARFNIGAGESAGGWTTARVGMVGSYLMGSCINGLTLRADEPMVLGNLYAVGFTNATTSTPTATGLQRLYIDGVKQSSEGGYASTRVKFTDYVSIGGSVSGQWEVLAVLVWGRALTPSEMADISANPYQVWARQFRVSKPYRAVAPKTVRGLYLSAGAIRQIASGQLGSVKPLVVVNGIVRQRVSTEGQVVILDQGQVRTLAPDETLMS